MLMWLGLVFSAATAKEPIAPPVITITAPSWSKVASGATPFAASVIPSPGRTIAEARFFVDGELVAVVKEKPFETRFDAGDTLAAHTLRVEAVDNQGQLGVCLSSTRHVSYVEGVSDTASFSRHSILVSVLGPDRKPLTNVRPEEFSLQVNGKPQPLLEAALDQRPLAVELELDLSETLVPYLPEFVQASDAFVSRLQTEDASEVTIFAGSIIRVSRFSTDHEATRETLQSIRHSTSRSFIRVGLEHPTYYSLGPGQTRLFDALAHAIESLNFRSGHRSIVILTDALENNSHIPEQEVLDVLQRANISVQIVRFGRRPAGYWSTTGQTVQLVRKLARNSGGEEWHVKTSDQIVPTLHHLMDLLKHRYRLVFSANPADFNSSQVQNLKVKVARKGVELLYPAGIHIGQ